MACTIYSLEALSISPTMEMECKPQKIFAHGLCNYVQNIKEIKAVHFLSIPYKC